MTRHLRAVLLAVLCVCTAGAAAPASKPTYSVIAYLTAQTKSPAGIAEGSPGVFYSNSAALAIFSVTKQGVVTVLASFPDPPNIVESDPIAGANGLIYSSLQQYASSTAEVFSVGPTAGTLTKRQRKAALPVSSHRHTVSGDLRQRQILRHGAA